jgi:hypothetical protein
MEKIIVYRQCLHGTIQIQNSTKTYTVPSEGVEKIIVFLKAQPQDQVWEKQSSMAGRFSGRPCSLQAGRLRTPPPPPPLSFSSGRNRNTLPTRIIQILCPRPLDTQTLPGVRCF